MRINIYIYIFLCIYYCASACAGVVLALHARRGGGSVTAPIFQLRGVRIFTYILVHIDTMYICICIYMNICICIYMRIHTYISTARCAYIYILILVHIDSIHPLEYIFTCIHKQITHLRIYLCMCVYVHTL